MTLQIVSYPDKHVSLYPCTHTMISLLGVFLKESKQTQKHSVRQVSRCKQQHVCKLDNHNPQNPLKTQFFCSCRGNRLRPRYLVQDKTFNEKVLLYRVKIIFCTDLQSQQLYFASDHFFSLTFVIMPMCFFLTFKTFCCKALHCSTIGSVLSVN